MCTELRIQCGGWIRAKVRWVETREMALHLENAFGIQRELAVEFQLAARCGQARGKETDKFARTARVKLNVVIGLRQVSHQRLCCPIGIEPDLPL